MRYFWGLLSMLLIAASPASAQLSGGGDTPTANHISADLQKGCDAGNAEDCVELGLNYIAGDGVDKNYKKAAALVEKGCAGGSNYACAIAASMFFDGGEGVPIDLKKSARYAERACDGKNALGCSALGQFYEDGVGGYPKDIAKAEALYDAGCFDNVDFSAPVDLTSAVSCKALAKSTGKPACAEYAVSGESTKEVCYNAEKYAWDVTYSAVPADYVAPVIDQTALANEAVNAGNAAYQRQDYANAVRYYAQACDLNSVSACSALGDMYLKGQGVARNSKRAAAPLAKACDGGDAASCGRLATLYSNGDGVTMNAQRSTQLHAKACQDGYRQSCPGSAQIAQRGNVTPPPSDAVAYFDELIAADAAGWMFNRYDRGSMHNMKIVSSTNNGRTKVVYGDYTFNGGQAGWVQARFTDENLECLEFWDFAGQCRPLGRSPSQGLVMGVVGAMADGMMNGGGTSNQAECDSECEFERGFLWQQQRDIEYKQSNPGG